MADQKRRTIACTTNRSVEDFPNIDISLLPFHTCEMRAITGLFLSPYCMARHATSDHPKFDSNSIQ
jgi:hypothetical protein